MIYKEFYGTNEFVYTIRIRYWPADTRQDWEILELMLIPVILKMLCLNVKLMYWMNPNFYLFLFVIDDCDRKYAVNKRMQLQVWYSITAFTIQMWYFCACAVIEFGSQLKRLIQKPLAKLFAPASLSCRHGIQYVSVP